MVKTSICFIGFKMSTNYSSAHLNLLPTKYKDSIEEYFRELKFGQNQFVIDGEFIYFLHDDLLSCVKINYDRKGIFHFFFDGRIIKFDRNTGNVVIVNFVENSQTFLCVGDFFQNPAGKQILLQEFLYSLIYDLPMRKYNKIRISHGRIFWGPDKMIFQIEQHGRERLDRPSDCISFGNLLRDIRLFFWIQWVSSLKKYSVIFQKELLRLKKEESFRNPQSIQMLYNGIPVSDIGFIRILFEKLLKSSVNKMVIMKWAENMFQDIFGRVIRSFFMNFGELKKSTGLMNKLIGMYPSISLKCPYSSLPNIPESLARLDDEQKEKIRRTAILDAERKKRIKIEAE